MARSHRIDRKNRIGVISFWDDVDGRELLSEARAFFGSDAWQRGYHVLWDARDVQTLHVLPEHVAEMRTLIEAFRPRIGPGRSAVVGRTDDVLAIGRLLKATAATDPQRRVEVFDSIQPALHWLGLGGDPETVTRRRQLR